MSQEETVEEEEDPTVKANVRLERSPSGYRYVLSVSRNDGVVLMPYRISGEEKPTKPLAWTSLILALSKK